jgi:phosphate:Na+ symporter
VYRRLLLLALLVVLTVALWVSAEVQTISAGVALFLFGMLSLEQGFAAFTGGPLERFLRRSTRSLPRSLTFGLVTTTATQSSALVAIMTISFLSAGLIGLAQGVGVVFGANLGTTTGAWLMAGLGMRVDLSSWAMPFVVFGVLFVLQKGPSAQGLGKVLTGLGLLLFGMHFMKTGFEAIQADFELTRFALTGLVGLLVYTGLGVIATVVMQSSHATLMLTIAALATQQLSYENALAVAIGANIGTTVTAVLGSLSANVEGKRLALAHVIFNAVTAVVAIAALGAFRWVVDELSTVVGIAATDWTLKLAVFHTLFNVAGVVLMVPVMRPLVRLLEAHVTTREAEAARPRYLNDAALMVPEAALEVLRKETQRLFDTAFELLAHGLNVHRHEILSERPLTEVVERPMAVMNKDVVSEYYRRVKLLYSEIIAFAALAEKRMAGQQLQAVYHLRIACRNIAKSIKALTLMLDNLNRFARSDNAELRAEYNRIRLLVSLTLRDIYVVRLTEEDDIVFVLLQRMRRRLHEYDRESSGRIDHLVRHGVVTKNMATSLMNDSGLAYDIGQWLLEVAQRLFVPPGSDLEELRDELLVEENLSGAYDVASGGAGVPPSSLTTARPMRTLTGEYRRLSGKGDG